MKKTWICVLLVMACMLVASAQAETLLVGVSPAYAPYTQQLEDGSFEGFDIALAKETGELLGMDVTFVALDWEQRDSLLADGTIDCIWSAMCPDVEEGDYCWSQDYAQLPVSVLTEDEEAGILMLKRYAVAFAQDKEELCAKVDGALAQLAESGEVDKLTQTWLMQEATEQKDAPARRAVTPRRTTGLQCPRCAQFISISVQELSTASSIACPHCGLQLNFDRQQTKQALEALQRMNAAQDQQTTRSRFGR